MPPLRSAHAAHTHSTADTSNQTYAMRTNSGKVGCTPCVFAGWTDFSHTRSAMIEHIAAIGNTAAENSGCWKNPASSEIQAPAKAANSHFMRGEPVPRNTGSQRALKPQMAG